MKLLFIFWFSHDVFANGGLLELWMSPKPNKKWGKDKEVFSMVRFCGIGCYYEERRRGLQPSSPFFIITMALVLTESLVPS